MKIGILGSGFRGGTLGTLFAHVGRIGPAGILIRDIGFDPIDADTPRRALSTEAHGHICKCVNT